MSSAVLMGACRDERPGIRIAYRTDGHLLNQRGCTSSRVCPQPFAEDCALNTASEGDMQRSMDLFAATGDNFGLIMNMKYTPTANQR
ncbi:hypothetical protein SprV_0100243500 [Sparganum proliferum]